MDENDLKEMRRATILRVAARKDCGIQAIFMAQSEPLTANDVLHPETDRLRTGGYEARPSWATLFERYRQGLS